MYSSKCSTHFIVGTDVDTGSSSCGGWCLSMMSSRSINYQTEFHARFVNVGVLPTLTKYFIALQVKLSHISVVCLTVDPGFEIVLFASAGS